MTVDVLIRDLPPEVHAELMRRASDEDKSLRAYVSDVLSEHVAVPSTKAWLQQARELGPAFEGGRSGAELVADARAEDDRLIGR